MLNHLPSAGHPVLRALFLASAAALVVGGAAGAVRAESPAVQASPAFTSDRLSVEVVGQGPDVILIPGLASSREVWRAEADRLKATHRVHLVQLAGFAGEPWTHGDGAFMQPMVDELSRYVAEQTSGRPAVIGHSMGALTGLMLAQQHPDQVDRLLSVDSLPFFGALMGPTATADSLRPAADSMASIVLSSSEADFLAGQRQTATGMAKGADDRARIVDWSLATDRHALASAMRDVMTTDMRPLLAGMTTPVTALYASDADGGAPAAMADAMWSSQYADLPGVRLVRIDGTRHFIMMDQPQAFARAVDAFLAP
ncbi:MAG: alpha/beta hydrolase [Brevundimonas sp.]|uniref:alpha/beta fold hydrolase n=1 Tax=Brevundimonas sp. TaxID=1871086 RepID=UPI0025B956AD|nr:alpha/beta hydrolase [Brevundimonas sp.]MBX3477329.1 alpha/beta hydrolase [Brevundimonas sp.]